MKTKHRVLEERRSVVSVSRHEAAWAPHAPAGHAWELAERLERELTSWLTENLPRIVREELEKPDSPPEEKPRKTFQERRAALIRGAEEDGDFMRADLLQKRLKSLRRR